MRLFLTCSGKQNLKFGVHADVSSIDLDLCKDCFWELEHMQHQASFSQLHTDIYTLRFVEFQPVELSDRKRALLEQIVIRENELRLGAFGQEQYLTYGGEGGYMHATHLIQCRAVEDFLAEAQQAGLYQTVEQGAGILIEAPHILGAEAAALSNYIKGSFAAFPNPNRLVPVGGELDHGCTVVTLDGQPVRLRDVLAGHGFPQAAAVDDDDGLGNLPFDYTVVMSGSVS